MLRSINVKSLSLAVSTLVLSTSVNAALIDNGILTLDDETGLQWLDTTETIGMSYNDAGTLEGYRHATFREIEDMMSKALPSYSPITTSDGQKYMNSSDSAIIAEVDAYHLLFGFTTSGFTNRASNFYLNENGMLTNWNASRWDTSIQINGGPGNSNDFSSLLNSGSSSYGTFLVVGESVSAVPVPAAAWLFGSGLIGLIGLARRKA